jgi:hypothetical protein
MIVGDYFDGDDDTTTAWAQHDVYGEALDIIVKRCREHVTFAPGLQWPNRCATDFRYDHRTLQVAHDLLAAAWRFRANSVRPALPCGGKDQGREQRMGAWLSWLRSEVCSWQRQPRLILLVMTILAEQHNEPGYQAEDELAERLKLRFDDVPWRLAGGRRGVVPIDGGADPMPCECPTVGRRPCNIIPCLTMAERAAREGWGPLE